MNVVSKKLRDRRNANELRRAIERANTPAMANELMVMSQRWV